MVVPATAGGEKIVSFADILQAIKHPGGKSFPATVSQLKERCEEKRGLGLFTDKELDTILEFFDALPQDALVRNTPKLAEAMRAAHTGLEIGAQHLTGDHEILTEEREDAPLGFAPVKPDMDLAQRVADAHNRNIGENTEKRE